MSESLVGAAPALLGALTGGGFLLIAGWLVYRRERESRRLERLRDLYSDVMLSALWLIPYEFGHRLSKDAPQITREQIDGLSARLRLESWWDGDHILEELIEIYRAVEAWKEHAEHGGEIQNLMDPLRQQVLRSLQSLEDEIRKNLGVPTPVLIPPRRRT